MTKRIKDVERLLFDKFGFTEVDLRQKNWRTERLVECADAIDNYYKAEMVKVLEDILHSPPNENLEYSQSLLYEIERAIKEISNDQKD